MSEPSTSFLAALLAQERRKPGPKCSIARSLRMLDAAEADGLRAALKDLDRYTNQQIADALKAAKLSVGENSVGRHRRGACQCPTS